MTDRSEMIRKVAHEIGEMTAAKNLAYGDSFQNAGRILEILYPDGIRPEQYRDALGIVRILDKLQRIATQKDAFGESPWKDIGGYSVIGTVSDIIDESTRIAAQSTVAEQSPALAAAVPQPVLVWVDKTKHERLMFDQYCSVGKLEGNLWREKGSQFVHAAVRPPNTETTGDSDLFYRAGRDYDKMKQAVEKYMLEHAT